MRATQLLLQHSARLTLFTRANCSLCDTAKQTISQIRSRRIVEYGEVDVMAEGQHKWKDAYEFDVPVLHIERVQYTYVKPDMVSEAAKLMHRFSEEQVEQLIDEAEKHEGDVPV